MSATILDVANRAGVSKSTVSKVLNSTGNISKETVSKVNRAIKELNYVPNSRAVSFARQTTHNIVYLTDLTQASAFRNPHMFDIMCGVYQELSEKGYTLTLEDIRKDKVPGETALNEIRSHSADGIIIHCSAVTPKLGDKLIKENIPHIIIGRPSFESRLCWIDINNTLAGEYAGSHFHDCGYTDIIYVGGAKEDGVSNNRLLGIRQALNSHNAYLPNDNVIYTDGSRIETYKIMKEYFSKHIPSAMICKDNVIALGAIKAAHEMGLKIPEDIGFMTFDIHPYSSIMDPTPTIIDVDVFDLGVQAGSSILRKLANPNLLIQSYTTLPMLKIGKSTVLK